MTLEAPASPERAAPEPLAPEVPSAAPPCPVCGCPRVERDAVELPRAAGALLLGECTRCDHRWTALAARPAPHAPLRRGTRARAVRRSEAGLAA